MYKQTYQLTVFIGDVVEETSRQAQNYDTDAFLIDFNNCYDFLSGTLQNDTTVYTSLGDLPKNLSVVFELLHCADTVVYCPVDKWSDHQCIDVTSPNASMQGLTEDLLLLLPKNINIKNFKTDNLITDVMPLVDSRKTNSPQLWFVGCSITHGVGVSKDQRFGQLIANEVNLPCSFLTRGGSAIDWASDQIIRSDIRPNDIVIWGLTEIHRLTHIHNNQLLNGITNNCYNINKQLEYIVPKKLLVSENTVYNHIYAIERAINFCKAVGAKLFIIGILTSSTSRRHLSNKKEFFQYPYTATFKNNQFEIINFKDLGNDNDHPGIQQHIEYKNFIIQLLNT